MKFVLKETAKPLKTSKFAFLLHLSLLSYLLFILTTTSAAQNPPTKLEPGKPIERQTKQGDIHVFEFNAEAGFYARLEPKIGSEMHPETVRRFLKNLVTVSVAFAPASSQGKWVLKEKKKKQS